MSRGPPGTSNVLVVCVDRDDDIGRKAQISTPVVGRNECIDAGVKLAVADPEEADANTIFAAVKQFDELSLKGYKCQVCVVSGSLSGGFEADQKLRAQVAEVVRMSNSDGAILVSDGVEDETVLPVLLSIVPITSVRRVIIKHSKSVEESYVVFGRYLRMLAFDPRYSRWALGVPGMILFTVGPLAYFNLLQEASGVFAAILGLALLVRAFDVDKLFSGLPRLRPSNFIRLFSILASLLIVIASIIQGYAAITILPEFQQVSREPSLMLQYGSFLIGVLLSKSIDFIWIGLAIYFGGNLLYHFLRGSLRVLQSVVGILVLALLYFPFQQFSLILQGVGSTQLLISSVLFGLAITFAAVGLIYQYIRSRRKPRV